MAIHQRHGANVFPNQGSTTGINETGIDILLSNLASDALVANPATRAIAYTLMGSILRNRIHAANLLALFSKNNYYSLFVDALKSIILNPSLYSPNIQS
ncbi:hypothetical protein AX774_g4664, partial [Zancudomyces culisetae]